MSDMPHYMGIDPGSSSGGIAVINGDGLIQEVFKLKGLTLPDLNARMCHCKRVYSPVCCLEKVHSMPKQGVVSTFKFGQNFGHLEMMLVGLKIPYTLVTPQKWQKLLSCQTKGEKNVSKARAQRQWPEQKMTHAIADALLLAEYCRLLK